MRTFREARDDIERSQRKSRPLRRRKHRTRRRGRERRSEGSSVGGRNGLHLLAMPDTKNASCLVGTSDDCSELWARMLDVHVVIVIVVIEQARRALACGRRASAMRGTKRAENLAPAEDVLLFEIHAAEMVVIGSGARTGRGVRTAAERGTVWSVLLNVLAADLRLVLDFCMGFREREENSRRERRPWLPSSSDQRDCNIFSPIRSVAETASGWGEGLARERG